MKKFNSVQKWLFYSGLILIVGGLAGLALYFYGPVRKPNFGAAVKRADAYAARGNFAAAFKIYNGLAKYYPQRGELYYKRGLAHFRTGNLTRALADFKQAGTDKKTAAPAFQWEATVYSFKKDWANQEAAAERALSAGADSADAFALRGIARANLGKNKEALEDLNAALAKNSGDEFLFIKKAQAEYNLKDYAAARADVDRALAAGRAYPDAHALSGMLYMQQGARAKAVAAFEAAVKISGGDKKYADMLNSARGSAAVKKKGKSK